MFNGNNVSYDLDGNMLSNGVSSFTYDSANKLVSADGHTYIYNAEDIRIRNVCECCCCEDTIYTYNTNAKLSQLLTKTTNGVTTKYVYGRGLIGEEKCGEFKTYHFDSRGSTVAITNASGNVTDTFAYDTYGEIIGRTGTSEVIFCYNGRDGVVTDANGLIYMRARYYSPEMKRFINADIVAGAISNAITLNRFAFANGNPVSFVDPFGLSSERTGSVLHRAWSEFKNTYNYLKDLFSPLINPLKSVYDGFVEELKKNSLLEPTALEAAHMVNNIYTADCPDKEDTTGKKYGEWKLVDIYDFGIDEIGLKVGVYSKTVNGETSYCLSYAGTNMNWLKADWGVVDVIDSVWDWVNNIQQPVGVSADMRLGIRFAKEFKKNHPDAKITITGHSKGGAEAAAAAVATNTDAILFNPATVALEMYGLSSINYTADMDVYVVKGEVLNSIFGIVSTPIDDFDYIYYNKGDAFAKHSMKAVISALKNE